MNVIEGAGLVALGGLILYLAYHGDMSPLIHLGQRLWEGNAWAA